MNAEFTAIIEPAPEGGFWAICPKVPSANGQGETIAETKDNLRQAIELILEDRKTDILPAKEKRFSQEWDDLDGLFGQWSEEEFTQIQGKIDGERLIDEELWKRK